MTLSKKYRVDKATIEELYLKEELSMKQIAEKLDVPEWVINSVMKSFHISRRTISEALIKYWSNPEIKKQRSGWHLTEEAKKKISEGNKGKPHGSCKPFSQKRKKQISRALKKYWSNLENKQKRTGWHLTKEQRQKISQSNRKRKGKIGGWKLSKETRLKMSEHNVGFKGKKHSAKTKKTLSIKLRKTMIKRWQNPEEAEKLIKGWHSKPNKCETTLNEILSKLFPEEYRYVGDGNFILGGKCPDFMNVNGKKKLIEFYGDYWHRNDDPNERINLFKQFGFDTLVIWEHELKDEEGLSEKIISFNGGDNQKC